MPDFVHLHLRSQYSLLNSCIRLPDLMERLNSFGMNTVAVTDRYNMFGAVDFYKRARKAGIKPILGVDALIVPDSRFEKQRAAYGLVLLARNDEGYANLRRLISRAWLDGNHYSRPRFDMELLQEHSAGLICLSGSVTSQIARAALDGSMDRAREVATAYRDLFEPGCFYLEVQPNGLDRQVRTNAAYRELGTELGIPLVATNNCLYLDKKDARAHEVLMCVEMGRTLDDPKRFRLDTQAYWLKPASVMWEELGEDFADALENTVTIAERCNVELELGQIYLPDYPVPEGYDLTSYLQHCSRTGLAQRYAEFEAVGKQVDRAVYEARLEEELEIIVQMGFPGYFMIVQDFINWAKNQDIPVGPGRGSGAGSIVAYALRITDIDPIPYGLLFERFLNPERVSMPDFDIDFCMNRRGAVIEYVTEKYGKDNVGQIATFGSLKARGVIKDVGRVLGLTYAERDRLSKLVPDVLGITLSTALEQEPRLREATEEDEQVRDLIEIALALEGLYKSPGMHAAGVVIGEKKLWDYVPVFQGQNGEIVTQFAKDEVEEAGLVKFDFLGLKTLTVIDDAVRMVNRARPADDQLELATLSLEDRAVYKLISKGDTAGIFQLESSGFQEMLTKMKPDCFEDIVAAVALYRPGPMGSGMHMDFIERKHGRQRVSYPHPSLQPLLKDTYGVIVYQEQVMQIAQVLAGFSLGAADILRRAMGKKKAEVMAQQRVLFGEGAAANGVDAQVATDIFDLMETFAQYGFNKSHSAAYALLTFQTGYLKTHHEVEFWAAVLTSDKDNADKVTKGIRNARDRRMEVLPPDINKSGANFDAVDGRILFGMAGVKGVGETAVEGIVEARDAGEAFTSLFDFCERVDLRRVNKKTIEALIMTGAFDFCGHPRARMVAAVDLSVERAQQIQRDAASGQSSFFDVLAAPAEEEAPEFPKHVMGIEEWPEQELLANEKASLGFYVSGHPLDRFNEIIRRHATHRVEDLYRLENRAKVKLAGVVTSLRVRPTRRGGKIAIVLFEDHTGTVELIAMGEDYDRHEAMLGSDEPLLATGAVRVDHDEGTTRVSLRLGGHRRRSESRGDEIDLESLNDIRAQRSRGIELTVPTDAIDEKRMRALHALLAEPAYAGDCTTKLHVLTANECVVTLGLTGVSLAPSDAFNHAVHRLFGGACTVRTT